MRSSSSMAFVLPALVAVFLVNSSLVAAQSACVASLVPCATYLTSTARPGSDCCDPLARVARTNITCLCDLAQMASSGSVNVTRALELPVLCNIPGVNSSTCGIAALAPGASTQEPPPRQSGANAEPPSSALSSLIFSYVTTVGLIVASAGVLFLQ